MLAGVIFILPRETIYSERVREQICKQWSLCRDLTRAAGTKEGRGERQATVTGVSNLYRRLLPR